MKTEQQDQILACMAEVLNQNGFRAEVMRKGGRAHAAALRSDAAGKASLRMW